MVQLSLPFVNLFAVVFWEKSFVCAQVRKYVLRNRGFGNAMQLGVKKGNHKFRMNLQGFSLQ